MQRRQFIKHAIATNLVLFAGFSMPTASAKIARDVFAAETAEDAMKMILGEMQAEESDKITIIAPDIAENGAVVPIEVSTTIEGAQKIALVIIDNPAPLAGEFIFGEGIAANVKTRCKVGKPSDIVAVVTAGDKVYTSKTFVKVTKGGC